MYDSAEGSRIAGWSPSIPDPASLIFPGIGLADIGVMRCKRVFAKKCIFRLMPQWELYAIASSPYAFNR